MPARCAGRPRLPFVMSWEMQAQAWPVSMRLILSPVTWKRQKVDISPPGVVAVSGEEIEPVLFFTLDVHSTPCGEDLAVDPVVE
jgi:hypothetical protein